MAEHDDGSSDTGNKTSNNPNNEVNPPVDSESDSEVNANLFIFSSRKAQNASWLSKRSKIKASQIAYLRSAYHIPSNYKIIIPDVEDRPHRPPKHYRSDVPISIPNENFELLDRMEALSLQERFEASSGSVCPGLDGARTILKSDWRVYVDSSIDDEPKYAVALELFSNILLTRDKAGVMYVEDESAHHLIKAGLHMHHLSLRVSFWKSEASKNNIRVEEYKKMFGKVRDQRDTAKEALKFEKKNYEAKLNEMSQALEDLKRQLAEEKAKAGQSFDAGRVAGRQEFAISDEFKQTMIEQRLGGAKDFASIPLFHQKKYAVNLLNYF
ncbi:hypothetical protein BUALT_Bualt02G0003500 [Buddleja alternifolia]|uniref:Uncharacterized protein n=1 Tax=Buddleja alternifolia TaxID=168488 RepID=A0AAV6XWA8_9LAMI|nr:hypothetical protein BUALT_Bualt02G0003500 [Buddleja alternifolia]